MSKSQISKNGAYTKYYGSDIFNLNSNYNKNESNKNKIKQRKQFNFQENTKEDLFNIGKQKRIKRDILKKNDIISKSVEKKRKNPRESDIFFLKRTNSCERRKGIKFIPDILNRKTILYNIRNDDDYTNYIKNYELMHRDNNNTYNPDIYINKETPYERYFRTYYNDNISTNNDKNKKDELLKKYLHDRKFLKDEIIKLNDSASEIKEASINKKGYIPKKRNKSEEKRFFADSKCFPKYNCKINRQIQMESNIFNNTKKEKDYFQEAKEIYNRIEKANKRQKLTKVSNINNTSIKIPKNNIKLENDGYSNNSIANIGKIKNLYDMNKFRKYDLITGKEIIEKIPVIKKTTEQNENKKIQEIIESIPNLSTQNKLTIKMKSSVLDFNEEKDLSQKCKELKDFYKGGNSIRKRRKKDITLKINEKNNNIIFNDDKLEKKPSEKYVMTYTSKTKFDKFDSNEIKNIFEKKGVQVYDIHDKNTYNGANLNVVSFKLKGENEKRIQSIENDLKKENYKVKIKKDDNLNKVNKEQINKNKEEKRFKIMPKEIIQIRGFTKKFGKY